MISTILRTKLFAVVAILMAATAVVPAVAAVKLGDQSCWSLDFSVRLEQKSAPPVEVHLTGDWISTVVAERVGEYDAQLQITDVQFAGDTLKKAPSATVRDLQQRLARPFWATYRSDGGLLKIHFFKDVSPSDRNLLQMIAAELQLVRPDSSRRSWTAQERDGAGEYLALYLTSQSNRILKRKLKYIYIDGAAGVPANALRVSIDKSSFTFTTASSGGVQAAEGTDRTHIDMAVQNAEQIATVTQIHIDNLRSTQAPDLVGSLQRAASDVSSSFIVTQTTNPAAVRAEADARLLQGQSTQALLAAAFRKDSGDTVLLDRLAALFRQRPEAAPMATVLLRKNGPQKRLTNSLGIVGSHATVSALSVLAEDRTLPENLRLDAITAFVQMQHPTQEAIQAPAALMTDPDARVRSAARLISGAMARAGREAHPSAATAVDASLISLYRKTRDFHECIELLGAMGNSAGAAPLVVIQEALRDERAPIRAAAVRALRLAPGSEIDELIAHVITSDKDPAARSDAIFAARFRHPMPSTIANALIYATANDAVDYVRNNALSLLRQNPTASPDVPDALIHIAKERFVDDKRRSPITITHDGTK